MHTPSEIEAEEAEEIGVEHLLRDIRDVAVGTLSTRITAQLQSLQGLHLRLRDIGLYLQKVLDGELPVNHAILANLQDVFNLLPNLVSASPASASASATTTSNSTTRSSPSSPSTIMTANNDLARAMSVKTNDQLMAIYLSSLIRAITAFHDLIENKIQNRQQQEEKDSNSNGNGSSNSDSKKDKDKEKENGASDKEDAGKAAKTNGVVDGDDKSAKGSNKEKDEGAGGKKEKGRNEDAERRKKG